MSGHRQPSQVTRIGLLPGYGGAVSAAQENYDVVVVGGGHNGLVSATYLAQAGLRVAVLERLEHTGGAAISERPWAGVDARLSRYSYLVSLLPHQVMADLNLDIRLAERSVASFTPWKHDGINGGLLVEQQDSGATGGSFRELTGSDHDWRAWQEFYAGVADLARVVAPTLTQPLPRVNAIREQVDAQIWADLVEEPLGTAIRRRFRDDTVRGVVATDALIGTFASVDEHSLAQNRCFLYHVIGNGDGEWRVPIGGMGAVRDSLLKAAVQAGAEVYTSHEVTSVSADSCSAQVSVRNPSGQLRVLEAGFVLSGVAPWTLAHLMGVPENTGERPEGSQLKINLLLDRLPRLRSGVDPSVAFAGTLHLHEGFEWLESAHSLAANGRIPDPLPAEIYCHTLTDRSILGPEAPPEQHTLTLFGLHTPARLFEHDREVQRAEAVRSALSSLQEYLAEPLMDCVARDAQGNPCIEAKVPQDIEADLAMPGGHIFHGDLAWPWAPRRARLATPAERWGVATSAPSVLFCGSGAQRGGAVSGIGGHNAAHAVLESI